MSTGKRVFDGFFDEVAELRDKVEGFDSDLFPVREPLTDDLKLDVDVTMAELIQAVRKRAVKLRDFGVTMHLRLTPEPKLISARGKLDVDTRDEQLMGAIEESARRGLTAFREYGKLLEASAELETRRAQFAERYDKLDPNDPERDRIKAEILGAGRVLDAAERKLLRDSRTLGLYLISLADAADTGAVEAQEAKCEEKKPTKPKGPRGPYRPPPRPAGGDDFEM
ncbi:MAG: hypothetical protein JRI23_05275 [Deltaproteobacteria bacterium]|nr:hypothetical protein [Deltaproteobacteria bacterium]MBW2530963.1 hypothetical protein [Deltaproteobacteria bacterium]